MGDPRWGLIEKLLDSNRKFVEIFSFFMSFDIEVTHSQ